MVSGLGTVDGPAPAREAMKAGIVEPTGELVDSKPLSRSLARENNEEVTIDCGKRQETVRDFVVSSSFPHAAHRSDRRR